MTDPVAAAIAAATAAANLAAPAQEVLPPVAAAVPPFAAPPGFEVYQDPSVPGGWNIRAAATNPTLAPPTQAPVAPPAPTVAPVVEAYIAPTAQAYVALVEQAAPSVAPTYVTPAVIAQQSTAVAVAPTRAPGKAITMNDVATEKGTMVVDYFLSVDENGIKVKFRDDDPNFHLSTQLIHTLRGEANFSEIQVVKAIRYEKTKGSPTYLRSFDGVVSDSGISWEICKEEAKSYDKTFRGDYFSVNFCMTLTEEAISLQGQKILPVGARVGFSTSVTNWPAWQTLYNTCLNQGLIAENAEGFAFGEVEIEVSHAPKKNASGNNWGVFKFQVLELQQEAAEAAPAKAGRKTTKA
jgi:hypothetical protein